jgi:hypothetical protein
MKVTKEIAFEDAIVEALVTSGGYTRGIPTNYDPALALDTAELFTFIGATQADAWEEIVQRYGGDPDLAQRSSSSGWPNRSTSAGRSTSCAMEWMTSASTSGSPTSDRPRG